MRLGFFISPASAMSLFGPLPRKPFKRPLREHYVFGSGAKLSETGSFDIVGGVVSCGGKFNIRIPHDAAASRGQRWGGWRAARGLPRVKLMQTANGSFWRRIRLLVRASTKYA